MSEPADIGSLDATPENEGWLRNLNEAAVKVASASGDASREEDEDM